MSTHVISTGLPDWDRFDRLRTLLRRHLREPSAVLETDVVTEGTGFDRRLVSATLSVVFDPDLTAADEARLARILSLVDSAVSVTPETLTTLLPTLRGLRDYYALPSPTAAQTVAAVKGLARVVADLLRDE
jgi:hypothetical protein